MVVYFNTDEFEMTIELGSSDDIRTVWDLAHVRGQSAEFSSRGLKCQMRKSRDNGYLELKLSDVLHYADDTLRRVFKLMQATWRPQPIKYRVRERWPITEWLKGISLKTPLREPFQIPVTINPAENMLYISYRKYKTWQSKTKTKYAKPGFQINTRTRWSESPDGPKRTALIGP